MKEKRKNEIESSTNDFASLLEESLQKRKNIVTGASSKVKLLNVQNGYLFIQTEDGTKGIIPEEEFSLIGEEIPKIDEFQAFFLKENHGDYIFTVCVNPEELTADLIEVICSAEIPIAGIVTGKTNGGYSVKLGGFTAFCPESQLDPSVKENYANKVLKFIITEMQKSRNKSPKANQRKGTDGFFDLVVSQKKLIEKEKEERRKFLKEDLKVGSFVSCKVKSIHTFGLIVDVDGIDAIIPKSEATYQINKTLNFKTGELLRAKVLSLDWSENKITLTVKDFIEDPWAAKVPFREGEIVMGTIESMKPYGLFVRLNDDFTGLVPSRETNVPERSPLQSHFKQGEKIEVFIMEINPEKRQLSLSIKKAALSRERLNYQGFLGEESASTSSLGDILKKALGN